jgi:hypothetical protein
MHGGESLIGTAVVVRNSIMWRLRLAYAGIAMSLVVLLWSARAQDASLPTMPVRPALTAYKGAGSCSAVACHGSIAPLAGSSILRNEHTTWISDDRHSRAFQVLFDDRSKQIVLSLAAGKDPSPAPAHQDVRCLACHTTPRLEPLLKETAWMNQDGVGCESCHGPAEKWLGPHTSRDWKGISAADKYDRFGFTNTKNLVSRIELCAGCHIGADARHGLPLRDVNHDLIAAGHPRLYFEFAAYHENQPRHWQVEKPPAIEAAVDFPARAWALGQLVSAKSALELLESRSARALVLPAPESNLPPALHRSPAAHSPWPEFAEYGCFSCHHSLADESWRRNRRTTDVLPGAPSWGTWYFPIAGELAANSAGIEDAVVTQYRSALATVVREMSRPNTNPDRASSSVAAGKIALDALIRELSAGAASSHTFSASGVEHLIDVLNRREAWDNVANWDEAAQRFLALVPLNQARIRRDPRKKPGQQALSDELRARLKSLAFPKGFDSPRGFDPGRIPARQNERSDLRSAPHPVAGF